MVQLILTQTDNVSGFIFAERLRKAIENLKVYYHDLCIKITISGGIASFPFNSQKPEELLKMPLVIASKTLSSELILR